MPENTEEKREEAIVIIGAGQAASQAVQSLRADGFDGPITLVGEEPYAPYQRPPLSKAYLLGQFERARLFLKGDDYYSGVGCDLLLQTRAKAIHRATREVELRDGRRLPYDKLLLTTGARVRKLNCPGADLSGVHYLKTIADVDGLQAAFTEGRRIAVVGGGYIGLEVAGGLTYEADIVLVGIGVVPCEELAREAGLACEDGIVVDRNARTSDPYIWSAGDCTRHVGREGHAIRLECVQNAIDQAKHAALAMTGKPKTYSEVPWFWSDQYDLKLQIAGLARPTDTIVQRGDPASRKFSVFHLRDGKVAAVEAVNAAPDYLIGKKLIAEGTAVDPARLADTAIKIKEVVG